MKSVDEIIDRYLKFSGERTYKDFSEFLKEVGMTQLKENLTPNEKKSLNYIEKKLFQGLHLCVEHGMVVDVVIEGTREQIERGYDKKKRKKSSKKEGSDLGKIVDTGKTTPGNADKYWRNKGIEKVMQPHSDKFRRGSRMPSNYRANDMRFLERYYNLRAFEFGNWLSQQDRENYLMGLGISLFDLHQALEFSPKRIGLKGKLGVSFGARGRGMAKAHFELDTWTINLTRYSRPVPVEERSQRFKRANLMLNDGGVGSFAHEYGHALDYFGGAKESGSTYSLSGDDSVDPRFNDELLKKKSLRGLMERLMFKIIWNSNTEWSDYYKRLRSATGRKYFRQRNEIFARAFEIYVHYKLKKNRSKNMFLNKVKYNSRYYLNFDEMRKLEHEFDLLIKALRKYL
jgi:hypothetical protein